MKSAQNYLIFFKKVTTFGLMKRIFSILLVLVSCFAQAQTLQQGRDLFAKGNYEKAKPIMLKYLKQKPQDASRNYWYGVCCMETGEQEKAIPYLEKAVEKKIFKANRALGEYYMQTGMYEQAIDNFRQYVEGISNDRTLHDSILEARFTFMADSLTVWSKMLHSTSRVCFIDSMVIPKEQLFKRMTLGSEAGRLAPADEFLGTGIEGEAFMPETGQSIVFSKADANGRFSLYRRYKSYDGWDDEAPLDGLPTDADMRYPFLLTDGTTVYFAQAGSESLGGLDIFVSRINPATGRYFKPENIGMPFNSSANDYMMAIDEQNGLGWFATDRGMNPDSVCLYIFLPETMGQYYNFDTDPHAVIAAAATLQSVAATQTDPVLVAKARQRLLLLNFGNDNTGTQSFTYIVDDLTVYHNPDDFQNPEARTMFQKWKSMQIELENQQMLLNSRRMEYGNAGASDRENMGKGLLDLENRVLELERKVIGMENEIRTLELNYLKK